MSVPGLGGKGRRGGREDGKASSGILGSLRSDPYPSVLLWMPQYENNPITVDPCTALQTQRQQLIKTEKVPIPSFCFCSVCVCAYLNASIFVHFFVYNCEESSCPCLVITHLLREGKFKGKSKAQSYPNMLFLSHQPDPAGLGHRVINLPRCMALTATSNTISVSFNYHPPATGPCVVCPQEELMLHSQ